jgi:ATP-dependent helicase STH1/SNF2
VVLHCAVDESNIGSSNFEERVPKKDYPDYYKVIKKPTAIADVKALVEKDAIQDWDTLAREVRLIWSNAKEYNTEGSDIYSMAEKLEVSSPTMLLMAG